MGPLGARIVVPIMCQTVGPVSLSRVDPGEEYGPSVMGRVMLAALGPWPPGGFPAHPGKRRLPAQAGMEEV
jgi:hypothetical protein